MDKMNDKRMLIEYMGNWYYTKSGTMSTQLDMETKSVQIEYLYCGHIEYYHEMTTAMERYLEDLIGTRCYKCNNRIFGLKIKKIEFDTIKWNYE